MKRGMFALGVALLAGCSDPQPIEDPRIPYRANWSALDDGSSVAQVSIERPTMTSSAALRCWPYPQNGFLCVDVSRTEMPTRITTVSRRFTDELPEHIFPADGARKGYTCQSLMGVREEISRDGQSLTSNTISYGSRRWGKAYVQNYIKENGVDGLGYFKCLEILNEIMKGSLATLGTTSINKAMAF